MSQACSNITGDFALLLMISALWIGMAAGVCSGRKIDRPTLILAGVFAAFGLISLAFAWMAG